MLLLVWLCGSLYAWIPYNSEYIVEKNCSNMETDVNATYYICSYGNKMIESTLRVNMLLNFVLTFLIPMLVLICSYVPIIRALTISTAEQKSQIELQNSSDNTANTQPEKSINLRKSTSPNNQSKVICTFFNQKLKCICCAFYFPQTVHMLFTVILLFGFCWLPIKSFQFVREFDYMDYCSKIEYLTMIGAYFLCHWIAMTSSFVNPIVYSFMSKTFRVSLFMVMYFMLHCQYTQ